MNFGPINQRGGEKRLNVIFSRAKHHMVVVSSIRHHDITNDHNDGANSLKNFLQYAEATSKGDVVQARRVLENLNPLARKALAPVNQGDAVVAGLATALAKRGAISWTLTSVSRGFVATSPSEAVQKASINWEFSWTRAPTTGIRTCWTVT